MVSPYLENEAKKLGISCECYTPLDFNKYEEIECDDCETAWPPPETIMLGRVLVIMIAAFALGCILWAVL